MTEPVDRGLAAGGPVSYRRDSGTHPPLRYPPYRSTVERTPSRPLVYLPHTLTEVTGPLYGDAPVGPLDHDLTRQHAGEPIGERIVVHGRVTDDAGRPIRRTLVEIWQANAGGRYSHDGDVHPAPIDPNFTGAGRTVTDDDGRYRFVSIKPGAYPWRNHDNAWRPAHIHFSLMGHAFVQRLVTQMYFPGDPLLGQDPIFNAIPDPPARQRLIAAFDLDETVPEWALAYRFDLVLCGPTGTPRDDEDDD